MCSNQSDGEYAAAAVCIVALPIIIIINAIVAVVVVDAIIGMNRGRLLLCRIVLLPLQHVQTQHTDPASSHVFCHELRGVFYAIVIDNQVLEGGISTWLDWCGYNKSNTYYNLTSLPWQLEHGYIANSGLWAYHECWKNCQRDGMTTDGVRMSATGNEAILSRLRCQGSCQQSKC